jgi:hypothetical protein
MWYRSPPTHLRRSVVTQHSLPSGRYSLLGPDLHRLDRTSFRLAHLLDHLVSERQQRGRQFEAERFGGCAVDHQLVLGRLLERQIAGFLAPQDAIDVAGAPRVATRLRRQA